MDQQQEEGVLDFERAAQSLGWHPAAVTALLDSRPWPQLTGQASVRAWLEGGGDTGAAIGKLEAMTWNLEES